MTRLLYSALFIWLHLPLSPQQPQPTRYIQFTRIDNQVNVYLNDALIFESEVVDGNQDIDVQVSLDKHLRKGLNLVKVELFNGSEFNRVMTDTHWEVRYEIFDGKESVDYMHQFSDEGKEGLSFEAEHQLFIR